MKKMLILIFLPLVMFGQMLQEVSLIPKPNCVVMNEGTFLLEKKVGIEYDKNNLDLTNIVMGFIERIEKSSGVLLESKNDCMNKIIFQIVENSCIDDEGYILTINEHEIILTGKNEKGVFYALQSLYQIIDPNIYSVNKSLRFPIRLPQIIIRDEPEYRYRGAMLDVGRYYYPKEFIKKFIDVLAFHKMNKFHWHLTDDQGWRIEIKKYPELTSVGSIRKETEGDGIIHRGYYTQSEIREIVKYAQERFIDIIPEIEMPGHSRAALAAYPDLSCTGIRQDVSTTWGVHDDIYCAGNEKAFLFLQVVLDEVIDLFPGKYIHIGGDEAPKIRWQHCEKCQLRIKNGNLKDEYKLQSYFIKRIEKYLLSKGRYIIGWDEILEGGLAPNAVVMSWRGIQGGIDAVKQGHDVIMSPNSHCYFDYYQAQSNEPYAIGGFTSLEKVYSYNPLPKEIDTSEAQHILGAQANLWTEYIPTTSYAEYMLLPRLSALAEVLWTKNNLRSFEDFNKRMITQYKRYGVMELNYRVPTPVGLESHKVTTEPCVVNITPPFTGSVVKYTTDDSDPNEKSESFVTPIKIEKTTTVKARTLMPDGRMGHVTASFISVIDTSINGLNYNYYEGNWTKLPDFSNEKELYSGKIYEISLKNIKTRKDHFAIIFEGYLMIDEADEYRFYLISDDGSKLVIDNKVVIDNDGSHMRRELRNKIHLKKGYHKIEVQYFEDCEGEALELMIEGNSISRRDIPASMLFLNCPDGK